MFILICTSINSTSCSSTSCRRSVWAGSIGAPLGQSSIRGRVCCLSPSLRPCHGEGLEAGLGRGVRSWTLTGRSKEEKTDQGNVSNAIFKVSEPKYSCNVIIWIKRNTKQYTACFCLHSLTYLLSLLQLYLSSQGAMRQHILYLLLSKTHRNIHVNKNIV